MILTKKEIVDALIEQLGYPRKQCFEIMESLIEIIKTDLEAGNDVLVSGFGKFCAKEKNERRGRNPATGDSLMLEPRRVVTFNCSAKLRERVNEDNQENP